MASDNAEGGEGGLKPDPGGSRLDSVAARVRFQQEKRRNCRCPFRTRSSREGGEAPPCSSQLSGHCPGAGIFPAVFPTPPPGCAPPVLGFWCPQPSQPPTSAGSCGASQSQSCGKNRLPAAPWGSELAHIPLLQSGRGGSARVLAHGPAPRGLLETSRIPWDFLLSLLELCPGRGAFAFPVPQAARALPAMPGLPASARECRRD